MTLKDFREENRYSENDWHRIRIMFRLLRVGVRVGHGYGEIGGMVFYVHDGHVYGVTDQGIWKGDFLEFSASRRNGDLPVTLE